MSGSWKYGISLLSCLLALPVHAQNAAQAAGAAAAIIASLDATKCSDAKTDQDNFKNEIVKRIRAAESAGLKPSLSYEIGDRTATTEVRQVDARASQMADRAAKMLFAAMANPAKPTQAAASALGQNPNRRIFMDMYVRCPGRAGEIKQIVQNQYYFADDSGSCPGDANPVDMGMNVTQIFETKLPAKIVTDRFAQSKLKSSDIDTVTVCLPPQTDCASAQSYEELPQAWDISKFSPNPRVTYYIQDSTKLSSNPFKAMIAGSMVNRTALRITPVSICGTKVYLATGFAVGNELGFDRSSLVGVIAQINGKTMIIGEASVQSFDSNSKPVHYFARDYFKDTMEGIFGTIDPATRQETGSYASIAKLIGSTERPVMGEIGGRPNMTYARHPVAAVQNVDQ